MKIIILHNSEDAASRRLVENIPKNDGNTYCIIDWYKQPQEILKRTCSCHKGQAYEGPSPSAFPELVFRDDTPPDRNVTTIDGKKKTVKEYPGWVRIREALSVADIQDRSKFESRKSDISRVLKIDSAIKSDVVLTDEAIQ